MKPIKPFISIVIFIIWTTFVIAAPNPPRPPNQTNPANQGTWLSTVVSNVSTWLSNLRTSSRVAPTQDQCDDPQQLPKGFMEVVQALKSDPCSRTPETLKKIRMMSLLLLKQSLEEFGGHASISNSDFQSFDSFKNKYLSLWHELLTHLYERKRSLDTSDRLIDELSDEQNQYLFEFHINKVLTKGVIILPTTQKDQEGRGPFNYTAHKDYFYLGIAPVEVQSIHYQELEIRHEHPFQPYLFQNMTTLAYHDARHADFGASQIFDGFDLKDSGKCQKFRECLNLVEQEGELEGVSSRNIRRGLLWESHDRYANHYAQQFFGVKDVSPLVESAFEEVLEETDDPAFNSNFWLSHDPTLRSHECALLDTPNPNVKEKTIEALSHLKVFDSFFPTLDPQDYEKLGIAKNLVDREIQNGMISQVSLKCRRNLGESNYRNLHLTEEDKTLALKNLKTEIEKFTLPHQFSSKFSEKIKNLLARHKVITDFIHSNKSNPHHPCSVFDNRQH